jgi:drug/metabolite transporter (DMT)-like permease
MWNALFVILGASLWATDTLFRQPLVQELSPITIVFYEHLFASIFALIWALATARKQIIPGLRELLGAAFIGFCGSALATVLFTMSFQFVNPSVAILMQKTQPLIVVFMSSLFLGEKTSTQFMVWAGIAVTSAFWVSFPSGFSIEQLQSARTLGALLAFLAAALWAVSTVAGKLVLKKSPESVLSFWRFAFGLLSLYLLSFRFDQARIEMPFVLTIPRAVQSLAFMALIPGFLGVILYYRGLRKVPASMATLLELSFPLSALWINSHYLGLHLTQVQLFAAGALLISMVGVSFAQRNS